LNSFQNAEKSDSAKAFGNDKRIKTPANQLCALITRIETNDLISDVFIVFVVMVFVSLGFAAVFEIVRLMAQPLMRYSFLSAGTGTPSSP
jgi:hypothetical protein